MLDRPDTPIPTLDLHAQFREVEAGVRAAIDRVLASQQFILGREGEALEHEIAAYAGCTYAVGVSSGTDALLAGLMALGVGAGDEVVTTPYTFVATITAIARLGARPVFVDVDPDTLALDPRQLAAALGPPTRAIVPVHLFGQMADMARIRAIAGTHGVPVLEDAAQAIGATRDGAPPGRGSRGATLSFFPSKNLGAMGDGGMLVTDDASFAERVRLLRNHGQSPKYVSQVVGGNFRLDELQAAILRAKLPFLEGWTAARRKHASTYRRLFASKAIPKELFALPVEAKGAHHVYNQLVARTPRRDALREHLTLRGIGSAVYYPVPVHLQPGFRTSGYGPGDFPESERAARETIALPLYPELPEPSIVRVVDEVAAFFASTT